MITVQIKLSVKDVKRSSNYTIWNLNQIDCSCFSVLKPLICPLFPCISSLIVTRDDRVDVVLLTLQRRKDRSCSTDWEGFSKGHATGSHY